MDVVLVEAQRLRAVGRIASVPAARRWRRPRSPAGTVRRHVVDAVVGEELAEWMELVRVPGALPEDADLGEPLHDEVVVVHPAGAADVAVGDARVPVDTEARRRTRGDRRRRAHLHDRAVVGGAVVWMDVAQRRREVGFARAVEQRSPGDASEPVSAGAQLARAVVARRAPSFAARRRREVVARTRSSRDGKGSGRARRPKCCATRAPGCRRSCACRDRGAPRWCSSRFAPTVWAEAAALDRSRPASAADLWRSGSRWRLATAPAPRTRQRREAACRRRQRGDSQHACGDRLQLLGCARERRDHPAAFAVEQRLVLV